MSKNLWLEAFYQLEEEFQREPTEIEIQERIENIIDGITYNMESRR